MESYGPVRIVERFTDSEMIRKEEKVTYEKKGSHYRSSSSRA